MGVGNVPLSGGPYFGMSSIPLGGRWGGFGGFDGHNRWFVVQNPS